MKAFLIDPIAKTVTEVDHTLKLEDIYSSLQVRMVQVLELPKSGGIYIDEEGKLKGPRDDLFYIQSHQLTWGWDVFGRGLVVGPPDEEGNETPAPFTLEEVQAMVEFTERVIS